jgi:hypothetical protein
LAGDPLRHLGKVLGHCVGLQTAAGGHQLLLEEPFLLEDPVAQMANLHRLKDFLRRTPDSLKRSRPTQLVARVAAPRPTPRGGESFQAELQMYADTGTVADTGAVHALVFDPRAAGVESILVGMKRCRAAGIGSLLTLSASESPRRASLVIDMAWAAGADLIAAYDGRNDALLFQVARRLAELSATFNRFKPG